MFERVREKATEPKTECCSVSVTVYCILYNCHVEHLDKNCVGFDISIKVKFQRLLFGLTQLSSLDEL